MTSMLHIPNHGAPDDQLGTRLPIPMAKRIEPRRIRKPRNKTLEACQNCREKRIKVVPDWKLKLRPKLSNIYSVTVVDLAVDAGIRTLSAVSLSLELTRMTT